MKDESGFYSAPLPTRRIAVLVDGENLSPDHAAAILKMAEAEGTALIRRIYGNAKLLPKWDTIAGFRLIHSGSGKNATDMLLVIEAMDLAHSGTINSFVIATSDRDFTHLAHHLRERGFRVLGLGEEKTAEAFRAACTAFRVLVKAQSPTPMPLSAPAPTPVTAPASQAPDTPAPARPAPVMPSLEHQIRAVIRANSQGSAGMPVGLLNAKIRAVKPVKITSTGHKNWRAYLKSRPDLFTLTAQGDETFVQIR